MLKNLANLQKWDTIAIQTNYGDSKMKTGFIRARTDIETKVQAEHIFDKLGITTTDAITMFYRQVIYNNGIPFEMKIPNKITAKVFKETEEGKNLIEYNTVNKFFADMTKHK